jgi:hypothetical protein
MTTIFPQSGFGRIHFGGVDLGDARPEKRLIELADLLVTSEADSLPDKLSNPADYRAFNSIVNRVQATHSTVTAPHRLLTRQRMTDLVGTVLVLHDTTELDFSGRDLTGLGPIGNGHGLGWECHNSLAVDAASGAVIGLIAQKLHRRPPNRSCRGETAAQRRERLNRESRLWPDGLAAVGPTPDGCHWVHISDRGSDTFEYLKALGDGGHSFVVRSKFNRCLSTGDAKLHDRLRNLPAAAEWGCRVRCGKGGCSTRTANLSAAWERIELPDPDGLNGSVTVWALRVWEPTAPAGVEALEWFLLTDRALNATGAAQEVAGWYCQRPVIEEYHKCLKTGSGVEKLQHRTREALAAAVGILSVVAIGLLGLRDAARDQGRSEKPAAELVGADAVEALSIWRTGESKADWSVREFVMALGRLGGHMNRKCDGMPGWLTMWRGLRKLRPMIQILKSISRSRTT